MLFLTRYPVEGASSRYRVFQYLPYLGELGVDCTVQSFMDAGLYDLSIKPGRTAAKVMATAEAVFRRLATLRRWRHYDVIYLQRELFPFGPPLVERWLRRRGAVLIFDYDDALFIKKASRYNPLATFFRAPEKTLEVFRLVHLVVAGNNWLRDQAALNGANAVTVEVAEDISRYVPKKAAGIGKQVTIGWLGSPSTVKYLKLIESVLKRIHERFPSVRFQLMGGGDFEMSGVPWELENWSLSGEVPALARFDIGLMPLPNEDWAMGKSGGKARTYMAAGVVPVCSAIGYNLELIDHDRTGMLCANLEDWERSLGVLILDAARRTRMAAAAREEVLSRFSPRLQAEKLKHALEDARQGGRA
ncbi:glycosyltransferase [Flagellatimonas centrodinii]|uniref:glycosyltransferase n=1 Tax=Flagellatimonas centrodinii TaxID=2806210 RepID=UPI001FEF2D51|nr:glycosyltransferase [Flagellatimonas centrodinii]ULQ46699.1 glycosyltransferase [Flagellatimonas centrodinii]